MVFLSISIFLKGQLLSSVSGPGTIFVYYLCCGGDEPKISSNRGMLRDQFDVTRNRINKIGHKSWAVTLATVFLVLV